MLFFVETSYLLKPNASELDIYCRIRKSTSHKRRDPIEFNNGASSFLQAHFDDRRRHTGVERGDNRLSSAIVTWIFIYAASNGFVHRSGIDLLKRLSFDCMLIVFMPYFAAKAPW